MRSQEGFPKITERSKNTENYGKSRMKKFCEKEKEPAARLPGLLIFFFLLYFSFRRGIYSVKFCFSEKIFYSYRSASIGSSLAAFLAGNSPKKSPTAAEKITAKRML